MSNQQDWVTGSAHVSPFVSIMLVGGFLTLVGGLILATKVTTSKAKMRCIKAGGCGAAVLAVGVVAAKVQSVVGHAQMAVDHPVMYALGSDVYGNRWISKPL